jgi:hypothetical protein
MVRSSPACSRKKGIFVFPRKEKMKTEINVKKNLNGMF